MTAKMGARGRLGRAARAVAVVLAASGGCEAVPAIDVRPPHLAQMIGRADLVVAGTISRVRDQFFVVEVGEVLAGATTEGTLVVGRAKRWPDEPRWALYAPDQRLVLFLTRASPNAGRDDPDWWVEGPVGRGELPVEGEFVYLAERYEGLGRPVAARVHGAEVELQRIELAQFISAVSEYSECFAWEKGDRESPPEVEQICDDLNLDGYASRSALHRHLVEESRRSLSRQLER